ncbi:MAG TPA: c-type cytochrome [Acidimicrobiales bacterium]|nr:c-type cytochrome [Acidimicrobiales bacterium]
MRVTGAAGRSAAACAAFAASLSLLLPRVAAEQVPPHTPSADAEPLYVTACAICHGNQGEGSERGPSIRGVGAAAVDYELTTGRMPLRLGDSTPERGAPAYSPEVIAGLVAYVASLAPGGEPVPSVDVGSADVARGGEVYRLNCAACHQAVGSGGALSEREAPSLRPSTPVQVAEAVRVGPGQMPAFGEAALDDADVANVAAYVTEVLHDPDDRGGLAIWHLGPVPEGAVAIVGALGSLMLFAVWVEGRARRTTRGS